MTEQRRYEVRVATVLPEHAQPSGWRYEALLPRMGGEDRWELSTPCRSWTEAKEHAAALERLSYRVRIVFVDGTGKVHR